MRIVCTSDTHMKEPVITGCDVFIHAGDMTFRGTIPEVAAQLAWMRDIPAKRKLLVPGNHDWLFQKEEALARQMCDDVGVDVLIDDEITINGVRFYGTPAQPYFFNWAFNMEEEELEHKYSLIPEDTDVLITHCPQLGVLDASPKTTHVGSKILQQYIPASLPFHIFGHIHHSYGVTVRKNGGMSINASHCDEGYMGTNPPITLRL